MSEKKRFDKDVEFQKIQILQNDFQARFNLVSSLWVAGLVGLLILVLTVYYNKQFNPDATVNLVLTIVTIAVVYALFEHYGPRYMKKQSNEFLAFVDELLAKVEKGDALGSIMELKKQLEERKGSSSKKL
jgi:uncharacterized membrane-anchored protein